MNDILVVDNDFIDKVAKSEQLELLRLEGKKIVITDRVYAELEDGVLREKPSAMKAMEWLDKNRHEPWLELEVPTKPLPTKIAAEIGGGEGSIVSYINEQKALNPSNTYTALTDNSNDVKKITKALDDPSRANVRVLREFTNDLAA